MKTDCQAEGVKPEKADNGAVQIFKEMHDEHSDGKIYSSADDFAKNWLKDLKERLESYILIELGCAYEVHPIFTG